MFEEIRGYKDVDALIDGQKFEVEHQCILQANVGDTVTFGECTDKTLEVAGPIEWIVLSKDNGSVMLVSKNILAHLPYNKMPEETDWEHSTLRAWLNSTFYMEAFDKEERGWIKRTTIENKDNMIYSTFAGNGTEDRVFLLSSYEANKLLSSKAASDWWWLRSPGVKENYASRISSDGKFLPRGEFTTKSGGVRPAIWVN